MEPRSAPAACVFDWAPRSHWQSSLCAQCARIEFFNKLDRNSHFSSSSSCFFFICVIRSFVIGSISICSDVWTAVSPIRIWCAFSATHRETDFLVVRAFPFDCFHFIVRFVVAYFHSAAYACVYFVCINSADPMDNETYAIHTFRVYATAHGLPDCRKIAKNK